MSKDKQDKLKSNKTKSSISDMIETIDASTKELNSYFPGGSTAIDSIKTRINSDIQGGTLQINGRLLTLEDLQTIRDEENKINSRRHKINLAVTIAIAIGLFVVGKFFL